MLQILPIVGIPEVRTGTDLAALLADNMARCGVTPAAGDVLVVTQKIVSKALGLFVRIEDVQPGPRALELASASRKDPRLVELALRESTDVVRVAPNVLITRHVSGHVMANAGIDQSNVGGSSAGAIVLLLPREPDRCAEALREGLAAHWPEPPAIIISDSFGRPWRLGVANFAIGASGLPSIIDRRGEIDRDGRRLEVTLVALADLIAAAAGLVTGEGAEGIPAAVVRGLAISAPPSPAAAMLRPAAEDLFR